MPFGQQMVALKIMRIELNAFEGVISDIPDRFDPFFARGHLRHPPHGHGHHKIGICTIGIYLQCPGGQLAAFQIKFMLLVFVGLPFSKDTV